jgi:hypothetical protein
MVQTANWDELDERRQLQIELHFEPDETSVYFFSCFGVYLPVLALGRSHTPRAASPPYLPGAFQTSYDSQASRYLEVAGTHLLSLCFESVNAGPSMLIHGLLVTHTKSVIHTRLAISLVGVLLIKHESTNPTTLTVSAISRKARRLATSLTTG